MPLPSTMVLDGGEFDARVVGIEREEHQGVITAARKGGWNPRVHVVAPVSNKEDFYQIAMIEIRDGHLVAKHMSRDDFWRDPGRGELGGALPRPQRTIKIVI